MLHDDDGELPGAPRRSSASLRAVLEGCRRDYDGPTLVFDVSGLRRFLAVARSVADRHRCELLFAVKSFPDELVLASFASGGVGFDVSNGAELELARRASTGDGIEPPIVSVTGPALGQPCELDGAAGAWAREVMVNVEAPGQLSSISGVRPGALRVGARLALDVPGDDTESRAGFGSRFGIDPADTAVLAGVASHPAFAGLHCHVEHATNDARLYGELAARVATVMRDLDGVDYVNLGGGLDRGSGADGLEAALSAIRKRLPDVRLLLEPGGWWLTGYGFALARIIHVKRGRDGRSMQVTVDLSAECHLRWTQPQLLLPAGEHPERERVWFCGPTCSEEDVIGVFAVSRDVAHEQLIPGSTVVFGDVNGYAMAWNTGFNGIAPARVIRHDADG